jgi:hypothetical protein
VYLPGTAKILHMKKETVFLFGIICILFSSCATRAFYQSPMHGNVNGYTPMPLHQDSSKSAFYGDLAVFMGWTNDEWHDFVIGASAGVHRAHNLGPVAVFYGANVSGGSYTVNPYESDAGNENLDIAQINGMSGQKSFGSWGLNGGISLVKPFANKGGEWRPLGIEYSWQKEWGDYYEFRNKLTPDAANLIAYSRYFSTISITTDIIGAWDNNTMGYKVAVALPTERLRYFQRSGQADWSRPFNLSQTFHFGFDNVNLFAQLNMGTHLFNFRGGMNFRF